MTSIGFVVEQVKKKYNPELIDIITRFENKDAIQKIKNINNTFIYKYNTFEKRYFSISFKKSFLIKYDLVIIPINGNLYSYKNVVDLANLTFGKTKIFFCDYNNNSFIYLSNKLKLILYLQKVITFITLPIVLLVITFYFLVILLFRFSKLLRPKKTWVK